MAHRIVRAGAALAATVVLLLPTAASADSTHDHASPSADPHASHDDHADHGSATGEDHADHDDHADPAPSKPAPSQDAHQHGDSSNDSSHEDHGVTTPEDNAGHDDHGATNNEDAGHTDHGTEPDAVSPEVRNFVLSGFAGVNAAVVFGAWMVRRTGPDPDPRKRTPKASR